MKFLLIFISLLPISTERIQDDHYSQLREKMIEEQIIARGISDRKTIDAIREVPRHLFVPADMVDFAYEDTPLPIGYDQTISQPYIVALMTEISQPNDKKKALEIGTGSGYQAAVLGQIVDSVFTIEIVDALARRSSSLLKKLGYNNIITKSGDGYKGWPEHAPFDIIIVTAAPEKIPDPLINQLAEDGRMVIPIGNAYSSQDLILAIKKNGRITMKKIETVRFVPFRRSL